jgi:uncharacterized protein (TIGR02246 family)
MTPATRDVMTQEAAAIRHASARWLAAAHALDAVATAAFYADDGAFLVPNLPLASGRAAVQAAWTQLLAAPNLSLTWTPTSVDVAPSGDMAYDIGTYTLAMDRPAGRLEDDGKYVVVWRKVGDLWHVAADAFNSCRPPG